MFTTILGRDIFIFNVKSVVYLVVIFTEERFMPRLWDSLSWFVMVEFGIEELTQLLQDGMVCHRCRNCGSASAGSKRLPRPKNLADIEVWIAYLDDPLVVRGCPNHQLEFHATREFREQSLSARSMGRPDQVGPRRLNSYHATGSNDLPNNTRFLPVIRSASEIQDAVFEHLAHSYEQKKQLQAK